MHFSWSSPVGDAVTLGRGTRFGRELGAALPGRYELAGYLFEACDADLPSTAVRQVLELLGQVANLEVLDAQATLDELAARPGEHAVTPQAGPSRAQSSNE